MTYVLRPEVWERDRFTADHKRRLRDDNGPLSKVEHRSRTYAQRVDFLSGARDVSNPSNLDTVRRIDRYSDEIAVRLGRDSSRRRDTDHESCNSERQTSHYCTNSTFSSSTCAPRLDRYLLNIAGCALCQSVQANAR